jgi:hypothetical protein
MNHKLRLVQLVLAGLFLTYAGARTLASIAALGNPVDLPDTIAYLRVSREPILDVDFWGSTRPAGFPLLLKIVNQDLENAAALQLGFSILAWGLLAWMITRFLGPMWLKPLAFGLILALSLDRHIAGWDFVMLSESLSISSLIVFITLGLWLLHGWNAGKVVLLCIVGYERMAFVIAGRPPDPCNVFALGRTSNFDPCDGLCSDLFSEQRKRGSA